MKSRKTIPLEKDVARDCVSYLMAQGHDVHRRNPGGFYYQSKSGRRKFVRQETPGAADFWFINAFTSIHVELEIKRPGGWPRTDQICWMLRLNEQGVVAFWVDSVSLLAQVMSLVDKGSYISMWPNGQYNIGVTRDRAIERAARSMAELLATGSPTVRSLLRGIR